MKDSSADVLSVEFSNKEYRESYAEGFLDTWISTQIQVLRQSRGMTQADLAAACGTKQSGIARVENANYQKVNLNLLRRIASSLDVRLKVSFETYGTLIEEALRFSRENLERPPFAMDPAFLLATASDSGEATAAFRARICLWVGRGAPSRQLRDWLNGEGLPATSLDEEPFRWILRGLPLGEERRKVVAIVAGRVREAIEEEPEQSVATDQERNYLYNLLQLGSGLESPELLWGPLLAMYERACRLRVSFDSESRNALAAALIRNQGGQQLREVWSRMLGGGTDGIIPGSQQTGWAGIRRMPTVDGSAYPDWEAVGKSLGLMATGFEEDAQRDRQFDRLIRGVLDLYGEDAGVQRQLVLSSFENQWPDWAKGAVPKLVVAESDEGESSWFLMSVPPCLFRFRWNPVTNQGQLEIVQSPQAPAPTIAALEQAMLDIPKGSNRLFCNWLRERIQRVWLPDRNSPAALAGQRVQRELLEMTGLRVVAAAA